MTVRRYKNLIIEVRKAKPKTILEIGTWSGGNALKMIREAQKWNREITYYGFDIFEDIDPDIRKKEFHVKNIITYAQAKQTLTTWIPHLMRPAQIQLSKGYTEDTLPKFKPDKPIDFIYIDGGHSLGTIENDWSYVEKLMHDDTVVIFDDFYEDNHLTGCCKKITELLENPSYSIKFLDPVDVISSALKIRLVKVVRQ